MNLITETFQTEPVKYSEIQLKIPDIQLDLYKVAKARGMLTNTLQLQQYLVSGFSNLVQKLPDLVQSLGNGTIFPMSGNKPCFNYMSQWLRLPLLKCLASCLPEDVRPEFDIVGLHKMDNPDYIPIYKKIFGYLVLLKAREIILWFFFQVPNYCDYNISGYRTVYEAMCQYATEHWPKSLQFKSADKPGFEYLTLGTTWYYNLVYHGQSNKDLLTLFSGLLRKIFPELQFMAPHIKEITITPQTTKGKSYKLLKDKGCLLKKCIDTFKLGDYLNHGHMTETERVAFITENKYRRIKIAFISNKLSAYTSVFRDRIGIIKNLNKFIFDTWIVLFGDERVLKAQIMSCKVINYFLESFIKAGRIIYLSKTDVTGNQKQLSSREFDIIFYPDLGMIQSQTLLAHARLAPLQITTWGHSDTSGNPEIDYYITSKWFEQINDLSIPKGNYSEKPILLSTMGTYYYSPRSILRDFIPSLTSGKQTYTNILGETQTQTIEPETHFLTAEQHGFDSIGGHSPIIIGCLQSFYKFNEEFESVLESILKLTDPMHKGGYPVYLALSNSISFNKKHLARLNSRLEPFTGRIKWFQNKTPAEWLNLVSLCHVMIDPFPFGGCNTSLEAFDYGIPVVCMPSHTMINGRFTQGFYKKMNITHCITDSPVQYIQQVLRLIQDPIYYEFIKDKILKGKDCLFEERACIDEYQRVLISLLEQRM